MASRTLKKRNRRIESHLDLVGPIAAGYAHRTGLDRDDLVQVGMLGLIRAAQMYAEDSGVPFNAYARPHIRGAILHYLRDSSGLIRLPRRLEERAQALINRDERLCSAEDQRILMLYRNKTRWVNLPEDCQAPRADLLDGLHQRTRSLHLARAMSDLPTAERKALRTVIVEGQSLREAAGRFDVSAMTMQRRVKRGLSRLAEALQPLQPLL